ncbi:hypothetical protein MMC07_001298 [Pseudocyphellaria aurata]|nr:hypothetical protein [Pseudocyphellaria aurata]
MAAFFAWDEIKFSFSFSWMFALTALTVFLASYLRKDEEVDAPLFKDHMFKIRRMDTDLVVISHKYLPELRRLPESIISIKLAAVKNHVGRYTTFEAASYDFKSLTSVVKDALTANLVQITSHIQEELDFAIDTEIPQSQDYTEVTLRHVLLRLVARTSSRAFVGVPLCRNEEWLKTSIEYTENLMKVVVALRLFPPILHPIVVWILPASYKLHHNVRTAQQLLVPVVQERNPAPDVDEEIRSSSTVLESMIDRAHSDYDRDPKSLALRQLLLSFASIHTTSMLIAQTIFDLYAHPEYIPELREEIDQVSVAVDKFSLRDLDNMSKLDSFIKESQRFNPSLLLNWYRLACKPLTLSDGHHLPKGTLLAIPAWSILMDPDIISNPEEFDPLRYYRKRLEPAESSQYSLGMIDQNHLHFGSGSHACPGRFFAISEMKLILCQLLLYYDFKYPAGKSRPISLTLEEFIFPDPAAKLLVKRRTRISDKVPHISV